MEVDNVDNQFYTEHFPGASDVFRQGDTYMDLFDQDEYAEK